MKILILLLIVSLNFIPLVYFKTVSPKKPDFYENLRYQTFVNGTYYSDNSIIKVEEKQNNNNCILDVYTNKYYTIDLDLELNGSIVDITFIEYSKMHYIDDNLIYKIELNIDKNPYILTIETKNNDEDDIPPYLVTLTNIKYEKVTNYYLFK